MQIYYTNLDRRPDRQQLFLQNNIHAGILTKLKTFDGVALGPDGLKHFGIDLANLPYYTVRTAGNFLSHYYAWQLAAVAPEPTTICEDDALLNHDFPCQAQSILASMPDDFDVMLWGWTFKCFMHCELIPGLRTVLIHTSQEPSPDERENFRKSDHYSQPCRCYAAWNSFAYTLSPAGARKLIDRCWPIRHENGKITARPENFPIYGVDAKLATILQDLSAWIAYPPLAFHPHDPSDTDMDTPPPGIEP